MAIRVGRTSPSAVYIGRPSVLGNPFVLTNEAQRSKVIEQYRVYFEQKVSERDPKFMAALNALVERARDHDVVLGCFCAPRACHGDVIKEYVERQLA